MIPQTTEYDFSDSSEQPTRTYAVDFANGRAVGFTDGVAAMRQAVFLILNTERFKHLIFSWDYGAELNTVIGADVQLAESELKRLIREALLQDERITAVDGFVFSSKKRGELSAEFTVTTIFGALDESLEVSI